MVSYVENRFLKLVAPFPTVFSRADFLNVKKMCDGILANQEMLAAIEAADTGKTYADAFGGIGGAADEGQHWADLGAVLDAEQDMPQPTNIDGTSVRDLPPSS